MAHHRFHILDVFAVGKYSGNQLAVVRQAADLTGDTMQAIAAETHFSETTFILSDQPRDGGYDVRIFTPKEELPFAGHPTLGTAFIIQKEIIRRQVDEVRLNLGVGQIPVTFAGDDVLWMKQIPPAFGMTFDSNIIARMLNLDPADIDDRFPIQDVSTGMSCIMVPLKSLGALKKARVDRERYFDLVKDIPAKAILIFCPEPYRPENNLSVRVFVDYYGIPEDPATGSANGCLAGYLVHHGYFGKNAIDIRVDQGYEIGRPSLLLLKAEQAGREIIIRVGGRVIPVAKGELT